MKYSIVLLLMALNTCQLIGQIDYNIDTFTVKYDTLSGYKSLVYEKFVNGELPLSFEKEFDLGFEMPYWDIYINKISIDNQQSVSIEGSNVYNMRLFEGEWQIYTPGTLNLDTSFYSDYRYKNGMQDNKKYFVIEHRHVAHNNFWYDKPQDERGDFNFQTWLWENGDIEIKFGKVQTQDTSIFKDNFGLITEFEGEGFWNAGLIGIDNYQGTEGIYYTGNYNSPSIINSALLLNDEIKPLTKLPHEGFVIRFKKQTSSLSDTKPSKPFPNVIVDILTIPTDFSFSEYRIFDMSGREIKKGIDRDVDLSFLQNGYYVIKLRDGAGIYSYKFVKQ